MKRNEFRLGTPRNFLLTRGLVGVERRTHYASKTFLINFNRMQFSEKIYETLHVQLSQRWHRLGYLFEEIIHREAPIECV